jgi:hypothetical protein
MIPRNDRERAKVCNREHVALSDQHFRRIGDSSQSRLPTEGRLQI